VLNSALAEFPILGTQLERNIHALRTNGLGLAVGIAGSLWGARGVTQAGRHAMAELWNIPGKDRPSFWTRQVRGLALLVVFALGLAAIGLLTGLGSLGSCSGGFRLANLALAAAVNVGLFLLALRVLTPRQIPPARRCTAFRCGPGPAVVAVPGHRAHLVCRRGQRRPRPPAVAAQSAAAAADPTRPARPCRPGQAGGAPARAIGRGDLHARTREHATSPPLLRPSPARPATLPV
jgi:Virulence factor BrkB